MLRVVVFLVVCFNLVFGHNYSTDINVVKFSSKEIKIYTRSLSRFDSKKWRFSRLLFKLGKKDSAGYTCMAIAWQESNMGDYMFNPITGDYGLMGINAKWYFIDHSIKGYYTKRKIVSTLIRDDHKNIEAALHNLRHWIKVNKNKNKKWYRIWASYNAGTVGNYVYARNILNRIIAIKRYFRKHPSIRNYVIGK